MNIVETIIRKKGKSKETPCETIILQKELNKSIGFLYKFRKRIQKALDELNKYK